MKVALYCISETVAWHRDTCSASEDRPIVKYGKCIDNYTRNPRYECKCHENRAQVFEFIDVYLKYINTVHFVFRYKIQNTFWIRFKYKIQNTLYVFQIRIWNTYIWNTLQLWVCACVLANKFDLIWFDNMNYRAVSTPRVNSRQPCILKLVYWRYLPHFAMIWKIIVTLNLETH